MAKTSYIEVPEAFTDIYKKGLKSTDRFQFAKIVRKDSLLSRKRKKGIRQRSLLPQIAEIWSDFSPVECQAWSLAGQQSGLTGWQLFVQDQCIRIINDIDGVATPSIYHQSWVGAIVVASPASNIKIAQYHPFSYFISKKVRGVKGLYLPVYVTEPFALPLELNINYKVVRDDALVPDIKFYAEIKSNYQGAEETHICSIPFNYASENWQTGNKEITNIRGIIIGYTLYIEASNFHGTILFDDVSAEHSGQNWVRDNECKNIDQFFTKNFYQVPKHWVAVDLPNGAEFDSIYPEDE